MKPTAVLAFVLALVAMLGSGALAAGNGGDSSPPTTDFHTVVTEPGSGVPGSGGAAPHEPHRPVCAWVRGGASEVDTVARLSGVNAQIIRDDADDHVLLVYRCDGRWDGRTWRWVLPATADELARDGLVELAGLLPSPQPITTPAAGQSSIASVPVFVWTDPATWPPFRVTRTDPLTGLSATPTATPGTMYFEPGDGSGPLAWPGPGVAYGPALANGDPVAQAPLAGRCAHAYDRLTRNVDGTPVAG